MGDTAQFKARHSRCFLRRITRVKIPVYKQGNLYFLHLYGTQNLLVIVRLHLCVIAFHMRGLIFCRAADNQK